MENQENLKPQKSGTEMIIEGVEETFRKLRKAMNNKTIESYATLNNKSNKQKDGVDFKEVKDYKK
jgi:hypothetical protein